MKRRNTFGGVMFGRGLSARRDALGYIITFLVLSCASTAALVGVKSPDDPAARLGYTAGISPKVLLEDFERRVEELQPYGYERRSAGLNLLLSDMGFIIPEPESWGLPLAHRVFLTRSSASPTAREWEFVSSALGPPEPTDIDGVVDLAESARVRVPKGVFVHYITEGSLLWYRTPPPDVMKDAVVIVGCGDHFVLVSPRSGTCSLFPRRLESRKSAARGVDLVVSAMTGVEELRLNGSDEVRKLADVRDALLAFFEAYGRMPRALGELLEESEVFPRGQLRRDGALLDEFGRTYEFFVDGARSAVWSVGEDGVNEYGGGDDVSVGVVDLRGFRRKMESR